MLKLSDFFQPLNLVNLLYFIIALIFFDILGTFVKGFFVKNDKVDLETRLINWLIGIGFFVFVWFVLGFFIIPTQSNLLISVLVLFCISLPFYLKNKKFFPFLKLAKSLWFPIVLVIPFLFPAFVKSSLPPYTWDEMAYHFISPYVAVYSIGQYWQFDGSIYINLPRLMDTLYILSFSLLHTYSVVRFIQFFILITSIFSSFLLIKKFMNHTVALLFVLIFLSLPLTIPTLATIGYVDIVALSFLLLGLTFGITFLFLKTSDYLVLSMLFWTMSIGTKYTTLIPFGAFIISLGVVYWIKNKTFKALFNKSIIFKIALILLFFGGYWYIKNFILFGNPIYPFFFQCWGRFAQNCGANSSFFGAWTIPVNLYTFYSIIATLLPGNIILRFVLVLSPFYIILFGTKKSKLISLMLMLSLGLDFISMKYFSGFDGRYQQYLMCSLILLVIVSVPVKSRLFVTRLIRWVILVALTISCTFLYLQNIVSLNSSKYLDLSEINYAIGKENIYNWINNILPNVFAATLWCDSPSNGPVALANFDPDMIWYSYSGLMRVYLVGCYYNDPPIKPEEWKDLIPIAKEKKLRFWLISINRCLNDKNNLLKKNGTSQQMQLWLLNNAIVCNSTEVVNNLYYFDFEKLK